MATTLRPRDAYRLGLTAAILAVLGVFLIYPIVLTVSGGFISPDGHWTTRYIASVFNDLVWMNGLRNSLYIAVATTIICLLIALPLSVLSSKYDFPAKPLLTSLLMVPLILPPFVGAIGMRAIMGRFGALNSLLAMVGLIDPARQGFDFLGGGSTGGRFVGVVLMEAMHLYPILYLNISAAMANLDPALDEAALGLGAGRWKRFFRITMPLIMPGLFAGSTIVFIWSFTELGTPLMFEFNDVTPVQVYYGIQEVASNPRPYALVVVMLTVAVLLYLVSKALFGGRAHEMKAKATVGAGARRLTGLASIGASGAFVLITLLAVLPHIGVIISSFSVDGAWYRSVLPKHWTGGHYVEALGHPLAMGSIRNSLVYASLAMVLCVLMGLSISYLTVRAKVKAGWLLDSLAMLPLSVPGLVMAFGYVAMTLTWPFPQLRDWLNGLGCPGLANLLDLTGTSPNPIAILVVAYAIRRLPYVVRAASAGLEQTSGELEEAALNLGASNLTAIRKVVLPLIMANVIAGAILAFSFAMLEVSDSLVLAQKEEHYPITKAIFNLFGRLGSGPYIASAMGVWGMALLTVTLVGAGLMLGKKMGALFRV